MNVATLATRPTGGLTIASTMLAIPAPLTKLFVYTSDFFSVLDSFMARSSLCYGITIL
jgi:hypothetical protein